LRRFLLGFWLLNFYRLFLDWFLLRLIEDRWLFLRNRLLCWDILGFLRNLLLLLLLNRRLLFNSWLLLCIYHYHLLPLTSIPLASNLHLFNLLNHSLDILLHDPLRLPTTGTTPDHHRHLTLTVPIEYLKLVLPHHLRCGPSSTHGAPAKRLGLFLLVGVEIGNELLFKLLHLVLVDLSDLGLEESHHRPVAAQLQVAGTVIENLLQILTEGLFCFIENAVGPTGDTCGVVLI
jgi:hypothetical protein